MNYWLIKSEESCYSIDDLKKDKKTAWTGIRNYQARNFIRTMKRGDKCLFYHSSCPVTGIYGIAEVASDPYVEDNNWSAVDMKFVKKFAEPITLAYIKLDPKLDGMEVTRTGSRLSIMPVAVKHFAHIESLV